MADDDVHRLRDILVEEVSLVDRAANKRRFLLVKREGDMSELRADGRGGFRRVDVNKGEDDETEKAKAKKPPFGGKAPPWAKKPAPSTTEPEPDEDPDDDEEKSKKAAPPPDDDEEKRAATKAAGADLVAKLGELVEDLQDVAQKMDDEGEDEPNDTHMKKILAVHRKLGGISDAYLKRTAKKSIEVAKIGRKMSASRLAMYKEALQTLQSLLSELMETPSKEKDHDADPGDPQVAAPGWKPANPSGVPANATGAAAMKAAIEKGFGELNEMFKRTQAKIARLEKGVVPSNAISVDGVKKNRGDEVVWPVDVNARPRGDKSVSFLDE